MTSLAVTDTGTAYPSGRRARDRFVLARRTSGDRSIPSRTRAS